LFSILENGQILLRTYSTMMANDTIMNTQDNSYDSLLENAQRTVFLKELFSQVNFLIRKQTKEIIVSFF
jgi:hypothetical protein